ncbi:hypothetical protein D3C76_601430 [compost metagenome]
MLGTFQINPLRQIDDAFDHFARQLINHVGHHDFAQKWDKWSYHQQRGIEDVSQHLCQVIEPGPPLLAIGVGSGNHHLPCVVEDFVLLHLVEIHPQVAIKAGFGIFLKFQRAKMKARVFHGSFTPDRPIHAPFFFMLLDLDQATVELGKEMPALLMGDEAAEELLVTASGGKAFRRRRGASVAQLAGQFERELFGRSIFFQGMHRVVRHIGNESPLGNRGIQVTGDQHDAVHSGVQYCQVIVTNREALQLHALKPFKHAHHHPIAVGRNIFAHQGQVCGGAQCALLAFGDFVLQHSLRQPIAGAQIIFKMFLVLRANIQFPTQGLELLNRHPVSDVEYFETTQFIRL